MSRGRTYRLRRGRRASEAGRGAGGRGAGRPLRVRILLVVNAAVDGHLSGAYGRGAAAQAQRRDLGGMSVRHGDRGAQ